MFLLAHFIPFFNFKEDFFEFYVKVRGSPPSQTKLVLNLCGAGSYFFISEKFWKSPTVNSIRICPTIPLLRLLLMQFLSVVFSTALWSVTIFLWVSD